MHDLDAAKWNIREDKGLSARFLMCATKPLFGLPMHRVKQPTLIKLAPSADVVITVLSTLYEDKAPVFAFEDADENEANSGSDDFEASDSGDSHGTTAQDVIDAYVTQVQLRLSDLCTSDPFQAGVLGKSKKQLGAIDIALSGIFEAYSLVIEHVPRELWQMKDFDEYCKVRTCVKSVRRYWSAVDQEKQGHEHHELDWNNNYIAGERPRYNNETSRLTIPKVYAMRAVHLQTYSNLQKMSLVKSDDADDVIEEGCAKARSIQSYRAEGQCAGTDILLWFGPRVKSKNMVSEGARTWRNQREAVTQAMATLEKSGLGERSEVVRKSGQGGRKSYEFVKLNPHIPESRAGLDFGLPAYNISMERYVLHYGCLKVRLRGQERTMIQKASKARQGQIGPEMPANLKLEGNLALAELKRTRLTQRI